MKCVAIISRPVFSLFVDGVTLRSGLRVEVSAAGYGGDMDEEFCNELLNDMDFYFDKVKSRKIEGMMPKLMKMVEGKERSVRKIRWA